MKSLRFLAFALMIAIGILALSSPAQASPTLQDAKTPLGGGACTPGVVAPIANVLGTNELFGIDALSTTDIWAVGSYFTPTLGSTISLVEHFDGTQWTHIPSPNGPTTFTQLRAVSALSATDVWAVGVSGNTHDYGLLSMHWNGTAWSIVPTPNPTSGLFRESLYGVVALTANDVWSVGYYLADTGDTYAITLHWDGTQWLEVTIPAVPLESTLYGVTAVSPSNIWAVGVTQDVLPYTPLILHWDGSAWSQMTSPGPGTLMSIDAMTASDIWAVGLTVDQQTLTMHWDGSGWSIVPSPIGVKGTNNPLYSVSGIVSDDVWAVGTSGPTLSNADYSMFQTLLEHWNGKAWSVVSNPAAPDGKLFAIDALSATDIAVAGAHGTPTTLVERWNGTTWAVAATPNPGLSSNVLIGVDALSPTDVWAVGKYDVYGPLANQQKTLVEHWDGYTWTTIPSPNGTTNENTLNSVDAISANDVWAVGITGDGGDYWTLTMHWDGTSWTVLPSPNPGSQPHYLQSVSAVSSTDVWAAGFLFSSGGETTSSTFIIHWDGTAWSQVSSPNAGTLGSQLYSVTAISANDAWAAGYYYDPTPDVAHPLLLHWNGTAWTQATAPALTNALLLGISAVSSNDVWAVGIDQSIATATRTLTMHWDGTAWSVVASPDSGDGPNRLSAVSAVSSDDVWAAGDFAGGTLIEHWDGSEWSVAYVATPGLLDNVLNGISALSADDVWAVGMRSAGSPSQTLAEHIGRFSDVTPSDYFFTPVGYLVAQGAISGYDDCTFRPGNDTTRGQLSKIVTLAQGWTLLDPPSPTFADVAVGSTFYRYIETMFARGLISGYPCGGVGEPCDDQSRPYFRPNAQVTRGQITKIVVLAKEWDVLDPVTPTFTDVPHDNVFYTYIETASDHTIINGYQCGGVNEPCDAQQRPYFRPNSSATRGQIAKIVYYAVVQP